MRLLGCGDGDGELGSLAAPGARAARADELASADGSGDTELGEPEPESAPSAGGGGGGDRTSTWFTVLPPVLLLELSRFDVS